MNFLFDDNTVISKKNTDFITDCSTLFYMTFAYTLQALYVLLLK